MNYKLVPTLLTEPMSGVLRNEHCVYQTEQELYNALLAAAPAAPVGPVRFHDFSEWMYRKIPPGTVIGDPGLWASKIYKRFILQTSPKPYPVELEPIAWQYTRRNRYNEPERAAFSVQFPCDPYWTKSGSAVPIVRQSDAAAVIAAKDADTDGSAYRLEVMEREHADFFYRWHGERRIREKLVDDVERCYRMLLSEPNTKGALFKAENILREALADAKAATHNTGTTERGEKI